MIVFEPWALLFLAFLGLFVIVSRLLVAAIPRDVFERVLPW